MMLAPRWVYTYFTDNNRCISIIFPYHAFIRKYYNYVAKSLLNVMHRIIENINILIILKYSLMYKFQCIHFNFPGISHALKGEMEIERKVKSTIIAACHWFPLRTGFMSKIFYSGSDLTQKVKNVQLWYSKVEHESLANILAVSLKLQITRFYILFIVREGEFVELM